jgi:hypothetical protein
VTAQCASPPQCTKDAVLSSVFCATAMPVSLGGHNILVIWLPVPVTAR